MSRSRLLEARDLLEGRGRMTAADFQEAWSKIGGGHLTKQSAHRRLGELVDAGYARRVPLRPGKPGRPVIAFEIDPNYPNHEETP